MWAGISTLLKGYRQLLLDIEHDEGRETIRTPSLFVGNNPLQLERVGLPEAEDVQNDRLAAVIVKSVGTAKLLGMAVRGALGQLGEDQNVRNFAFRTLSVHDVRNQPGRRVKVATDGEIVWMRTPLEFSIAPERLMLMVSAERKTEA
jgi:diacylglycerol kinase family enzyme